MHVPTWFLFGWANIAMYIYTEHFTDWQAIVGLLLTAVLDFAIVGVGVFACRKGLGGMVPASAAR